MKGIAFNFTGTNGTSPTAWVNPAHIMFIQIKGDKIEFALSNGERLTIGLTPGDDIRELFKEITENIVL